MDSCWSTAFLQLRIFHGGLESGVFKWMSVGVLRKLEGYLYCVGGLLIYFALQICGGAGRETGRRKRKQRRKKEEKISSSQLLRCIQDVEERGFRQGGTE
jgi:hypothetical protein